MAQKMNTTARFEGLMVFHPDPGNNEWEVGFLDVGDERLRKLGLHGKFPPHIFDIKKNGKSVLPQNSKGSHWYLNVLDASGNPVNNIQGDTSVPKDRSDPRPDQLQVGWLINLQKEFHPNEKLQMVAGGLSKILHLSNGSFYTSCKTEGIDYFRDSDPTPQDFGFITETVVLLLTSSEDQQLVLTDGTIKVPLPFQPQGYQLGFENVPAMEMHDQPEHFQLYYNILFPDVKDRRHLKLKKPPVPSTVPCPMNGKTKHGASIPPYKCGGIIIDDDSSWNP